MHLVVARATVENIEAHVLASEHGREAIVFIPSINQTPVLTRNIRCRYQMREIVLRPAIVNIEVHAWPTKLGRQAKIETCVDVVSNRCIGPHHEKNADCSNSSQRLTPLNATDFNAAL